MFKLERNSFETGGSVIYLDENNNKIIIQPDKKGENLTVKFKFGELKIESLKYKAPYLDIDGASFKLSSETKLSERETAKLSTTLHDAVDIIERWILLSQNLYQLFGYVPADMDDKELELVTYEILDELEKYEETQTFAKVYKKLLTQKGSIINV